MALNKVFTGNMVDKDGIAITNVLIKGFHLPTGTWSTVYDTGTESQYNVNLGDGGWLTQDGTTTVGDTILLRFETQETLVVNRQFSLYEFNLTSADTYVQDIQLKDVQTPNVNGLLALSSTKEGNNTFYDGSFDVYIARINDIITASNTFNDEHTWAYGGVTLKQVIYSHSEDIFSDRLGIDTVEYDWLDDGSFAATATHSYPAISNNVNEYYIVNARATNTKGLQAVTLERVQVRYNIPIPDLSWDPVNPSISDTFTIYSDVDDVDGRVTNIQYQFNGALITNNTTLNYSWVQSLGTIYQPTHTVNSNVSWNDGFNTLTDPYFEVITMTNLAPTFTLTQTIIGNAEDNDIKFSTTGLTDPDGDDNDLELKWIIEYKTPFDNTYKVVYDPGYPATPNLADREWIFYSSGEYRVTAVAKDGFGLEYSESLDISLTSSTSCTGTGTIKLNNDAWQLIAIPVEAKTVNDYFLAKVATEIQAYNAANAASDVIEICNAYPGHLNKFLSFVPDFTNPASEHNFSLIIADGLNINEVTGFWIKVKDYHALTGGADIEINWDQQD